MTHYKKKATYWPNTWLLISLSLFVTNLSKAQDNYYYNFTVKDGLPSNIVYHAVQNENDILWIATEKGISIYNGYDFQTLDLGDKLKSTDIWKLIIDRHKRIWIFTINSEPLIVTDSGNYLLSELTKRKDLLPWYPISSDLGDAAYNNMVIINKARDSLFYIAKNNTLNPIILPKGGIEYFNNGSILYCYCGPLWV